MHQVAHNRSSNSRRTLLKLVFGVIGAGLVLSPALNARADDQNAKATALVQSSAQTVEQFLGNQQWEALRNILGGARAIIIIPHDVAGGFLVTASGGDGVLLRRHGPSWSDPVFIHVGTVGVGFAAGVESQSIVMAVMTDAGADGVVSGVTQVGGGGSIALGDLGLGGGGSGDSMSGGLQVLTVSTAKGLFAGSDVRGMNLSSQDSFNTAIYGTGYNMSTIVTGPGGSMAAAADLRAALAKAVAAAWGQ